MHPPFSRRTALRWLGAASVGGSLMPARLVLAAAPSVEDPMGKRLVVVVLRGALDGLAAVPAYGDASWSSLRGDADAASGQQDALRLDNMFAMHPSLVNLHKWYGSKELLVMHAVASPYRERSHFDAQQLLESGGERPFVLTTGWLGRALQNTGKPAIAMTAAMPLGLRGSDGASTWTPDKRKSVDPDFLVRVAQMYRDDPPLASALVQAMGQQDMAMGAQGGPGFANLARQAGLFLAGPKGPRVAWLELGGWDTHSNQTSRLVRLLTGLDEGLAALREAVGIHWAQTTILVMTEFGRSATYNGTGGTDHGTGGVAFVAGGGVAGGQVLADWPGVAKGQLLDGRDLNPTRDLRDVIAPLVQHQFSLSTEYLQSNILPGIAKPTLNFWSS